MDSAVAASVLADPRGGVLFAERVRALRESWSEARTMAALGAQHDRDSQEQALHLVYHWCGDALAQVNAVYGADLALGLSQPPSHGDPEPAFTVDAGALAVLSVQLRPTNESSSRWNVVMTIYEIETGASYSVWAGKGRSYWTQGRVHGAMLTLLETAERARTREPRESTQRRPALLARHA